MANDTAAGRKLRECDIIMRGGITSGVVYPGVLAGLAKHYRFRNIGGASAGAIAAGVAAAAEYGRRQAEQRARVSGGAPDFDPFADVVAKIPEQIGGARDGSGGTSMRRLFQAHGDTAQWADMLWLWVGGSRWRALGGVAMRFGFTTLLITAMMLALLTVTGAWGWAMTPIAFVGTAPWWGLASLALAIGLLTGAAALLWAASDAVTSLRGNGFGLATGTNPALGTSSSDADYLATGGFADWMHATIQKAAGRTVTDVPLVMGDLWGSDNPLSPDRQIDLLLTTTNLSQQLPHQFPFLERSRSFLYFDERDLRRVLPAGVVDYMAALQTGDPRRITGGRADKYTKDFALERGGVRFVRLPMACDMPVLFGVRLSLSFPMLISAVKLYDTYSWRQSKNDPAAANPDRKYAAEQLKPCWFSDGGITSNFPVNSFDSLLPLRPTFCISLADLPEGARPESFDRVQMSSSNSDAIRAQHLVNLESGGLLGFLGAIVATARNGHENELVTMPGQRDRIVTIYLDPKSEGGLNLAMSAQTITRLADYGKQAAALLIDRFGGGSVPVGENDFHAWENHRWVRMRASLAAMERLLVGFDSQWAKPQAHDGQSYSTLIQQLDSQLPSYLWEGKLMRLKAAEIADKIAGLAATVAAAAPKRPAVTVFDGKLAKPAAIGSISRNGNAPRPIVRLALRPGGSDPRA